VGSIEPEELEQHATKTLFSVGQRLVIYVPKDKASQYTGSAVAMQNATSMPSQTASTTSSTGDYVYYTVRSGDNLWSIAQKFPGVSNSDIMSLNNLQNSKLSVGQTLKIKPKANYKAVSLAVDC
jgi:membrane-bound lytic murein transglycosylase D